AMDTDAIASKASRGRAAEPSGMGLVTFRAAGSCAVPPDVVYATLADIHTGLVWAGEQQFEKYRLLTLDGPERPAGAGTGWNRAAAARSGGCSGVRVPSAVAMAVDPSSGVAPKGATTRIAIEMNLALPATAWQGTPLERTAPARRRVPTLLITAVGVTASA